MAEPGPLCVYEKTRSAYRDHPLNRPEKKNSISRDLYWRSTKRGTKPG